MLTDTRKATFTNEMIIDTTINNHKQLLVSTLNIVSRVSTTSQTSHSKKSLLKGDVAWNVPLLGKLISSGSSIQIINTSV